MANAYERIAQQAEKHERVQTLMHYVNKQNLIAEHKQQQKGKAKGIDGVGKEAYGENLEANIDDLLIRMKAFSYRPQAGETDVYTQGGKRQDEAAGDTCIRGQTDAGSNAEIARPDIRGEVLQFLLWWLKENIHGKPSDIIDLLNKKLVGHYRYYGISGNYEGLLKFYRYIRIALYKTLTRCSQRAYLTWRRYRMLLEKHPIAESRIYVNIWQAV